MSGAVRYVALGLVVCLLSLLLREAGFKGARLVGIIGIVGLVGISAMGIERIFEQLFGQAGDGAVTDLVSGAMRIVGLGYIFGICSDVCRELGEPGVASAVLTVGRVEIFLASVPYLSELLDTVGELVGK